ncbi:hypothetical protein [Brucella intermedia]|uniref:Tail fiber protein n=1 Tax=Brucella intermedia M86 TaxID=1234597 RepID=M5JR30_9HYPH|nr:hypothetical protein [Brucella intermedia]ELT50280.1 hypothetical protein D584_05028 [Brucella intermedia M86]
MAQDKTSNYQFALPNPVGIQIAEMQKVADSIIAIDAKLKASETALSTHRHSFAELTGMPTTLAGYGITDAMTADEIAEAIREAISGLLGGATPEALDTLTEIANALGNNPDFAATVSAALGLRVRVDAPTAFSAAQKVQGRANIDALGIVDKGKANGVASLDGTGKVPSAQLPAMDYLPIGGGTVAGNLIIAHPSDAANLYLRATETNRHIFFQDRAGANQGLLLQVAASNNMVWRAYALGNPSSYKDITLRASDGALILNHYATDANEATSKTYVDKRSDGARDAAIAAAANGRAYPRKVGGGNLNFNWSGQPGQPTWVWGGTGADGDAGNMFVWNPANFNVNAVGGWNIQAILNQIESRAAAFADDRANRKARKCAGWDQWNFTSHDQRAQNGTGENIYYTARITGTYANTVQLQVSPNNVDFWTVGTTTAAGNSTNLEYTSGCLPPGWWMRLIRGSGDYNANVILIW